MPSSFSFKKKEEKEKEKGGKNCFRCSGDILAIIKIQTFYFLVCNVLWRIKKEENKKKTLQRRKNVKKLSRYVYESNEKRGSRAFLVFFVPFSSFNDVSPCGFHHLI